MALPRRTALREAIFLAEEGTVVYATRPFTADSDAMLVELDFDGYPPKPLRETLLVRKLEPFLDSDDVSGLLDVQHEVEISEEQLVELVLYYAENHEYPRWFHELEVKD